MKDSIEFIINEISNLNHNKFLGFRSSFVYSGKLLNQIEGKDTLLVDLLYLLAPKDFEEQLNYNINDIIIVHAKENYTATWNIVNIYKKQVITDKGYFIFNLYEIDLIDLNNMKNPF